MIGSTDEEKTPNYGEDEKIDLLVKIINRFDFYINSTNTKASIIIAWNGVLIGTVLLKYSDVLSSFAEGTNLRYVSAFILFTIGAVAVGSNLIVLWVIFPFLKFSSDESDKDKTFVDESIFYFGSLAKLDAASYHTKIINISAEKILKDASDQAVTIAKGLDGKMWMLKWSLTLIAVQLALLLVLTFLKVFLG
jgi:hypothetical protein